MRRTDLLATYFNAREASEFWPKEAEAPPESSIFPLLKEALKKERAYAARNPDSPLAKALSKKDEASKLRSQKQSLISKADEADSKAQKAQAEIKEIKKSRKKGKETVVVGGRRGSARKRQATLQRRADTQARLSDARAQDVGVKSKKIKETLGGTSGRDRRMSRGQDADRALGRQDRVVKRQKSIRRAASRRAFMKKHKGKMLLGGLGLAAGAGLLAKRKKQQDKVANTLSEGLAEIVLHSLGFDKEARVISRQDEGSVGDRHTRGTDPDPLHKSKVQHQVMANRANSPGGGRYLDHKKKQGIRGKLRSLVSKAISIGKR